MSDCGIVVSKVHARIGRDVLVVKVTSQMAHKSEFYAPSIEPRESQSEEVPIPVLGWNNYDVLDILVVTAIRPSVALRFRTECGGTLLRHNTLQTSC